MHFTHIWDKILASLTVEVTRLLITLIVLIPILVGLSILWYKGPYPPWMSFIGLLLGLIPIGYGSLHTGDISLTILPLFGSEWQFHEYTLIAAFFFTIVGATISLFITKYLNKAQIFSFCLALSSALGITMAKGYLSLFLFWEMLTLSTALIIFLDNHPDKKVGKLFLITHLLGGLALLFGIMLHYNSTGSLALIPPVTGQIWFLLGIGLKVGFVPLHFWIPATYAAINPVATVALSIFTTKAGILVLAKLFAGLDILIVMGTIMIYYGILLSLRSQQLRGILSYQHISQLGFMVVSIGAGGALGVNGAFLHMTNHMVYKSLLFMATAILLIQTNNDTPGTQKARPNLLLGLALVGTLAIVGMPPFNGFVSKAVIKYAVPNSTLQVLLTIAAIGTTLSLARFLYYGFWAKESKVTPGRMIVTPSATLSMLLLAGMTIVLGATPTFLDWLTPYSFESIYSLSSIWQALLPIGIGILLFLIFHPRFQPITNQGAPGFFGRYIHHGERFISKGITGIHQYEKYTSQLNKAQYVLLVCLMLFLLTWLVFNLDSPL